MTIPPSLNKISELYQGFQKVPKKIKKGQIDIRAWLKLEEPSKKSLKEKYISPAQDPATWHQLDVRKKSVWTRLKIFFGEKPYRGEKTIPAMADLLKNAIEDSLSNPETKHKIYTCFAWYQDIVSHYAKSHKEVSDSYENDHLYEPLKKYETIIQIAASSQNPSIKARAEEAQEVISIYIKNIANLSGIQDKTYHLQKLSEYMVAFTPATSLLTARQEKGDAGEQLFANYALQILSNLETRSHDLPKSRDFLDYQKSTFIQDALQQDCSLFSTPPLLETLRQSITKSSPLHEQLKKIEEEWADLQTPPKKIEPCPVENLVKKLDIRFRKLHGMLEELNDKNKQTPLPSQIDDDTDEIPQDRSLADELATIGIKIDNGPHTTDITDDTDEEQNTILDAHEEPAAPHVVLPNTSLVQEKQETDNDIEKTVSSQNRSSIEYLHRKGYEKLQAWLEGPFSQNEKLQNLQANYKKGLSLKDLDVEIDTTITQLVELRITDFLENPQYKIFEQFAKSLITPNITIKQFTDLTELLSCLQDLYAYKASENEFIQQLSTQYIFAIADHTKKPLKELLKVTENACTSLEEKKDMHPNLSEKWREIENLLKNQEIPDEAKATATTELASLEKKYKALSTPTPPETFTQVSMYRAYFSKYKDLPRKLENIEDTLSFYLEKIPDPTFQKIQTTTASLISYANKNNLPYLKTLVNNLTYSVEEQESHLTLLTRLNILTERLDLPEIHFTQKAFYRWWLQAASHTTPTAEECEQALAFKCPIKEYASPPHIMELPKIKKYLTEEQSRTYSSLLATNAAFATEWTFIPPRDLKDPSTTHNRFKEHITELSQMQTLLTTGFERLWENIDYKYIEERKNIDKILYSLEDSQEEKAWISQIIEWCTENVPSQEGTDFLQNMHPLISALNDTNPLKKKISSTLFQTLAEHTVPQKTEELSSKKEANDTLKAIRNLFQGFEEKFTSKTNTLTYENASFLLRAALTLGENADKIESLKQTKNDLEKRFVAFPSTQTIFNYHLQEIEEKIASLEVANLSDCADTMEEIEDSMEEIASYMDEAQAHKKGIHPLQNRLKNLQSPFLKETIKEATDIYATLFQNPSDIDAQYMLLFKQVTLIEDTQAAYDNFQTLCKTAENYTEEGFTEMPTDVQARFTKLQEQLEKSKEYLSSKKKEKLETILLQISQETTALAQEFYNLLAKNELDEESGDIIDTFAELAGIEEEEPYDVY